ncbi:LruC domain-containing protein [Psychromonas hadalis]|uniref:LruC domain-containing protein n=1 Tax=Psychromonas hadalis TaxID=211669 RepID=UPI0006881369|nr:LruC domain-containing protein [Psychromonas hadalis]
MITVPVTADPFSTCPSKAFLFQGNPVSSYGVNLVTGNYALMQSDPGIAANINGLGFDEQDRYLYGFNTTHLQMVRMGSDFKVSTLNLSGLPVDTSFFVGDVANHYYYLYRTNVGLYRVDLSPLDTDVNAPLIAIKITSTSTVKLTDFAFHPNSQQLYGVDNKSGILYQIDPGNGNTIALGDTGETGTFGAMYFDVNGYFYLSRNQDGLIYRIDLSALTDANSALQITDLDVTAVIFANGPSSSQNDGARCASAPLIDVDVPSNIDFSDAPSSYQTLLADNGPRHLLDGETYLGLHAPDGDYDGYIGADSDDSSEFNSTSFDDEDGVNFVTALEIGLDSVVSLYASNTGILNAWFDWNGDGDFNDDNEHVFNDITLVSGNNNLVYRVPNDAVAGNSWSRFRFSKQSGLAFFGGSSSGEVEDHPISINESGLTYRYYPSASSWVTLAYEDQWPISDDYDMNDVVMRYRTVEVIRDNHVVRIDIFGELQALGGDYRSGFAVHFPNILTENVNRQTLRLLHNDVKQQYSGQNGATSYEILESDNIQAVVVISQDLWKHVSSICKYFRSEENCQQSSSFDFEISIPLINPVDANRIGLPPFDPFIFATEGLYYGETFSSHPGRSVEIHLVDHAPTEKFNTAFFGLGDDDSDPAIGRYFRNSNNLPWALEVGDQWQWPSERKPLLSAYPQFQEFVETQGAQQSNWFNIEQAVISNLFSSVNELAE